MMRIPTRIFSTAIASSLLLGGYCWGQDSRAGDVRAKLVLQTGFGDGLVVHTPQSVAYSPTGEYFAISRENVKLFSAASGRELNTLRGHRNMVMAVVISNDGRRILTGSADGTARLWVAATGKELTVFTGHASHVTELAISPDSDRVLTHGWDKTIRLWNAESGKELGAWAGDGTTNRSLSFSSDGRHFLTRGKLGTVLVLDAGSGKVIKSFRAHDRDTSYASFFPAGCRILTGDADGELRVWDDLGIKKLLDLKGHTRRAVFAKINIAGTRMLTRAVDETARLWDLDTGRELLKFQDVRHADLSADGRQILTADKDSLIQIRDVSDGSEVARFQMRYKNRGNALLSVQFSPDGQKIFALGSDYAARVWDVKTGNLAYAVQGESDWARQAAFSPDGESILIVSGATDRTTVRSWDCRANQPTMRVLPPATGLALRPDGRGVLSGKPAGASRGPGPTPEVMQLPQATGTPLAFSSDLRCVIARTGKSARISAADTGSALQNLVGHDDDVLCAAFSPDGASAATGGKDKMARLWDVQSGECRLVLRGHENAVAEVRFSPDGRRVVTASSDGTARLWDAGTGRELQVLRGHDAVVWSAAFSPDGRRVVTAGWDGTARVWRVDDGTEALVVRGHEFWVNSAAFSPDGRRILTASFDGTARLWDAASGRELCRLIGFNDGRWAVVDPAGRFDADDLDGVSGLHWVAADAPFTALPLEVYMREYYEPRLLARVVGDERFPPVRSLQDLNRVQPLANVAKVEPQPGKPDEVTVTVTVGSRTGVFAKDGKKVTRHSGVFDLRLFRDGRLVGAHGVQGDGVALDPATGEASLRFEHVQLPRAAGDTMVEFSAYAFNTDLVKSETHRLEYARPAGLTPRRGTAYVVSVGVNGTGDPAWNLRYAVPDAEAVARTLGHALTKSGQFERVVTVPLLSHVADAGDMGPPARDTATKDVIAGVLAVLAGKPADKELLARVPAAAGLGRAAPEDVVVVTFSGHGHTAADGEFYLFPADLGPGPAIPNKAVLRRAVSAEELSRWLRGVDAGEMALVVDACFSAAGVEAGGFKPGPMGSRGLGQLAYDKRMLVLTASQSSAPAFEDARLGHGLLTYALCSEGLEKGAADFSPNDGQITLKEWLQYGAQRVPTLLADIVAGKVRGAGEAAPRPSRPGAVVTDRGYLIPVRTDDQKAPRRPAAQVPALFDFTKGRPSVTLRKTPADEWTDLIGRVDLSRHAVLGNWKWAAADLLVTQQEYSRLVVPLAPRGNYEFRVRMTRDEGDAEVNLLFPVGDAIGMASIWDGKRAGLNLPGEPRLEGTDTFFANGRPQTALVRVTTDGAEADVTFEIEGKKVVHWKGKVRDVQTREDWRIPAGCVGLGAHDDRVRFHAVAVRMLTGAAEPWAADAPGEVLKAAQSVDVLGLADPSRHRVTGDWKRAAGGVHGFSGGFARLAIPVRPDGGYELEVRLKRVAGDADDMLILPVGQAQCACALFPDRVELQKSPGGGKGATRGEFPQAPLTDGKEHVVVARVTLTKGDASIQIDVDGKRRIDWTGPATALRPREEWRVFPNSLGLGTYNEKTLFTGARLKVVSGTAVHLKGPDTGRK